MSINIDKMFAKQYDKGQAEAKHLIASQLR